MRRYTPGPSRLTATSRHPRRPQHRPRYVPSSKSSTSTISGPSTSITAIAAAKSAAALKRRCRYLHVGYPDVQRERDIILSRVPGISSALAEQIAEVVWEAVHDDSPKVTFVAGADAKATYGQRLSAGVEAFRAGIRQMFLGS